ncbi:MAG: hypothetical protein II839_11635 [Kiritimatiellae bacterium]|nr:hypothetical protein [Kiritimatiellia bacterium]
MRRLLSVLPLLALAAGCAREPSAPAPVRGALLVTVEGAFPDFTADGFDFRSEDVSPVSPEVLPSAASVLTAAIPPWHGLRVDGVGALDPSKNTIAVSYRKQGYDCAAFLSDIALSPVHGLTNGFSVYSVSIAPTNRATRFHRTTAEVCAEARDWLAKRPADAPPAFVWLHLSPYAGLSPTNAPALAAAGAAAAATLEPVVRAFAPESPVLVLPLFGLGSDPDVRGLDLSDPAFLGIRASFSGLETHRKPCPGEAVCGAPAWFGVASQDARVPGDWCESLVPWYAFRLPPLLRSHQDLQMTVLAGLDADPVAVPLAHQNAMAVLRANGHLGEGLVPPYTNEVYVYWFPYGDDPRRPYAYRSGPPAKDLAEDFDMAAGAARVARWRAAVSAPATNRVAALRALVESDPDVPLFHHELGEALMREKDFTGACNELAAASRLGWNMVLANRLQARCHAAIGNVPAAIDRAEAAFLVNEGDGLTRRELSDLLLRTGAALLQGRELVSARDCLARSLLLEPGRPDALLLSARLDLAAGQTNLAVRTLDDLLKAHPRLKAAADLRAEIRAGGAK